MWERILEIIKKEFHQTLRNSRTRALLFGPPLLQLIVFGYAVNLDIENSKIAWVDMDRTPESRELLAAFEGSRSFRLVAVAEGEDIQEILDHSRVQCVIRVLSGFSRDIQRGNAAAVQVLVDGTNSNTGAIALSYVNQVVAGYAAKTMAARQNQQILARTEGRAGPVYISLSSLNSQPRIWFNPDLKSRNFFIPGVVVNIIALVTIMLTSMSIVREKEIGTMEQLMVTPIRPVELILGKLLPFALIGVFEVVLIVVAALLIFNVPFQGSAFLLFGCAILFLLTTLGIGLFISTVSNTQQQAMMATFFFFMPAMLLSGFAFPIRNMPAFVQILTYLNPLRYFIQIVRGIFLKGTGLQYLWPQILALLAFGLAILTLSAIRFHKRLD